MKRTIVSAAVLALMAGGVGVSVADPGPNGNNTFGLCKAYFSGSEQGREKKRQAPPFRALEEAAEANDQTVEEYCDEFGQHPGGGNGGGGRP